jgi:hypothetical protein
MKDNVNKNEFRRFLNAHENFYNRPISRVEHIYNNNGNPVRNQFRITTNDGEFFQSYKSIIVFLDFKSGKTFLDENKWDYSVTTGKYRNLFLGETKRETEKKIKSGEYVLYDLNSNDALESAFFQ